MTSAPVAARGLRTAAVALAGFVLAALVIGFGPDLVSASDLGGLSGVGGETVFTLAIFGPLLVIAVVGGRVTGVSALKLGARPMAMAGLGLAIGLAGILLAVGYAALAGVLVRGEGDAIGPALALGVVVVLVQVAAEEVYFRGWLQPLIGATWGLKIAVPAVAIGFALLHIVGGLRGPIEIANLVLGGLLFGLLAARGGGVASAIGAHLAWNGVEQLGLGLDPNPGLGAFGALIDFDLVGKALWGGSDDGLNASVAMTLSLLALLVFLMLIGRRRSTAR